MVAIAFLILAVVIAIALIPDLFDGLLDNAGEFYTATKLKPKVGVDEVICDLRVNVNANMVQDINIGLPLIDSKPKIAINQANSHTYDWFNCKFASQYTPFDLLNQGDVPQQNVILFPFDTRLNTKIAIIDAVDSTQRVDSILQPHLERFIPFNGGSIVATPFDVSMEYVISDIPVRNYKLEIFYEADFITGINNQNLGSPYIAQICDENSVLRNGQCTFVN